MTHPPQEVLVFGHGIMEISPGPSLPEQYPNHQSPARSHTDPGTPGAEEKWNQIRRCTCANFEPSKSSVVTCGSCGHDVLWHDSVSPLESHKIRKRVAEKAVRRHSLRMQREFWTELPDIPMQVPLAGLEVVDITEDRRVFMVLDEGCNRTCHGEAWIGNARTKMLMQEKIIELPTGKEKRYAGLGTTTSKGRTAIPIALRLSNGWSCKES